VSNPKEVIRRFWAERARLNTAEAARFHSEHTPYDQAFITTLVKRGMRVLDLGCGTCIIANWLVTECGATVHAVDNQEKFLSHAKTSQGLPLSRPI